MKYTLIVLLIVPFFLNAANNYQKIVTALQDFNKANPALTTLLSIGKNDQGQDIMGIKISSENIITDKVNHLVVGTHHGNEGKSADLALAFIDDVIKIYKDGTNPLSLKYQRFVIHVIPVLNISGYNANSRYEMGPGGSSYDANRDYEDPCSNKQNYLLKSTLALTQYMDRENIVASATLHGYIGTFTFPWGTYAVNTQSADYNEFFNYAREAARSNNYDIGTHTDVIYPTVGAFEDWAYYKFGIWSTLLELAGSPNLSDDSKLLQTYFSLVPDRRSTQNQHGDCRQYSNREFMISRP